jgi:uncharacterized membrane protein YesL
MYESRLVRILDRVSSYFFLNLFWILVSLPIVTLPFSTLALVRTVRFWLNTGQYSIVPLYPVEIKNALVGYFVAGVLWLFLGILIVANMFIIAAMPPFMQLAFYLMNVLFLAIYAVTSAYLLVVLSHFDVSATEALKLALYFSQLNIWSTLASLSVLIVTVALAIVSPLTLAVTVGVAARLIYSFCSRDFSATPALEVRDYEEWR